MVAEGWWAEWDCPLGGSGDDNLTAVIQAQDGGIVAVGYSDSSDGDISANNGRNDGIIVKLNAQGER